MIRKTGLLLGILVTLCFVLAACGNKSTTSPSPAANSNEFTPTPTEEAVTPEPEKRVLREIWDATCKVFQTGNFSFSGENIYVTGGEEQKEKTEVQFVTEKDAACYQELKQRKYDSDSGSTEVNWYYVKKDGGVLVTSYFEDNVRYELTAISAEDASYYYPFLHSFGDGGDPLAELTNMNRAIFGEYGEFFPVNADEMMKAVDATFATWDSLEKLEERFGLIEEAPGKYSFTFKSADDLRMLTEKFINAENFKQFSDYYGNNTTEANGEIKVNVTIKDGYLTEVIVKTVFSDGTEYTMKHSFADFGKASFAIPAAVKNDFEDLKANYAKSIEATTIISDNAWDFNDMISGNWDKDNETLGNIINTIYYMLQDDEINKKVLAEMKGEEEIEINYKIGEKIDRTGLPTLDAALQAIFKDQTFSLVSRYYMDMNLTLYIVEEQGRAQIYYNLY
ncbi:MAG: hypothetical protein IKW95_02030 [Lachnospiraceae bacterium]|nr:hypothetical protein [Lachnospiraceae bacterium]